MRSGRRHPLQGHYFYINQLIKYSVGVSAGWITSATQRWLRYAYFASRPSLYQIVFGALEGAIRSQ